MGVFHRISAVYFFITIFSASYALESFAAANGREVSGSINVEPGGFRLDHETQEFVQLVRVRNTSGAAIPGAVVLVLDDVPAGVEVSNSERGLKDKLRPAASNAGALRANKSGLPAGATADFLVRFKNPERKAIRYNPHFYELSQTP